MSSDENTASTNDLSMRQASKIAGFGYLAVFVLATFSTFALENLIVPRDAALTISNIRSNELLFRLGIAGWITVMIADTIVAWALYVFLKPVNKSISLLAAWFRLVFVAIFASTLINHFSVLQLIGRAGGLTATEMGQVQSQVMQLLNAHEYGVHISFLFFGIHIFFLGYLILKSDYIPNILGVLLVIASVGYTIDSFGNYLSSGYASNELAFILAVAIPAIISELLLTIWLLVNGFRKDSSR